jgi:hypothetical protein
MIQLSAAIAAGFITYGLYALPDTPLMQLASHSPIVYMFRWAIIFGSVALLATKPPRSSTFRNVLGMLAVGFVTWTSYSLFNDNFPMLDGLLFIIAGIGFGLAALEVTPAPAAKKRNTVSA